jgi:hypothetical protein
MWFCPPESFRLRRCASSVGNWWVKSGGLFMKLFINPNVFSEPVGGAEKVRHYYVFVKGVFWVHSFWVAVFFVVGVDGVRLSLNCSHQRAYCSHTPPPPQTVYEFGEPQWSGIGKGKPKNSEKILAKSRFVQHKSHMNWHGREAGPPRWEACD